MLQFNPAENAAFMDLTKGLSVSSKDFSDKTVFILFETAQQAKFFATCVVSENSFGVPVSASVVPNFPVVTIDTNSHENIKIVIDKIARMKAVADAYFCDRLDLNDNTILPFNDKWFVEEPQLFGLVRAAAYSGELMEDKLDHFLEDCAEIRLLNRKESLALDAALNFNASKWQKEIKNFLLTNFHGGNEVEIDQYLLSILKTCAESMEHPNFGDITVHESKVEKFNRHALTATFADEKQRKDERGFMKKSYESHLSSCHAIRARLSSPWSNQDEPGTSFIAYLTDRSRVRMNSHLNKSFALTPKSFNDMKWVSFGSSYIRESLNNDEKFLPFHKLSLEAFNESSERGCHALGHLTSFLVRDIINCVGAAFAKVIVDELSEISVSQERMSRIDIRTFWGFALDNAYKKSSAKWFNGVLIK